MRQTVFLFLKIVVSVLLVGFLIYKIGLDRIIGVFLNLKPWHVLLALISIAINIFLGAINIELLLKSLDKKLPFWKLQRYYLTSWSLGLFVPGKLGEFSIIHYLRKYKISLSEGLLVSLADKGITFVVLILLSLAGIHSYTTQNIFIAVVILSIAIIAMSIIFFLTGIGRKFIKTKILGKRAKAFKGFAKAINKMFSKPRFIALNVLLTLVKWMVTAVAFYFILTSFGEQISVLWIASIYAATIIVSLIPVSFSGLGVKEGAAYFLFAAAGVNATTALSIYFIFTLLGYGIAILAIALAPKN
ncbi:MAG TPA: lysylphosphatidylglycerol synthase transmembrane domain-containing protein [Candidatus Nanoarchaeia archaeon]|nr:lysylphosphatidylglycerol synthase transmembrane domain-containing protein [Candidatus Nanoarchaeia archaeon]